MAFDLSRVNAERQRKGKKPLSMVEARKAADSHNSDSGLSMTDFLIGHVTGIGYNASSLLGSLTHSEPSHSSSQSDHSNDQGYSSVNDSGGSSGGDTGGGGSGD